METKKTKTRRTWVTGPLDKPSMKIPPHNDGPWTGDPNGVPGDYMHKNEIRKYLDDSQEELVGMPMADVYGAVEQRGKCVYCRNPIYMTPTLLMCPYCRRQLTIEAPGYDSSTYNKGLTDNKMLTNGNPEDAYKLPSANELRQNMGQYDGGGPSFNDVKG